ncbi:MAG: ATP-binding protein, partial [Halieaceae bacterium]|nr:ATP-binding protein [Halieaceae bacterium]
GILGFAELLSEPDLSGEEKSKYIGVIMKSGQRMLNIINDLIDISKIEAGQMELVVSNTKVNEQLDFLYTFFKPEAESKSIKFNCKKGLGDNESNIITDKEKLYAILTNLLKNAMKYTHAGGVEYGYSQKGEAGKPVLEFFVKDTGIGIAPDRQQAIFERFVQADLQISKPYEGAGLGLAITKAYCEMLGGDLWVESEPGKGSIFRFTIPYQVKQKPVTNKPSQKSIGISEEKLAKLKILAVEDDETADIFLTEILEGKCRELLHVKNGEEAIKTCKANPDIDLVLMDIKMPVMDGYTATREIRKFNTKVIIIAQTAYALAGDKEKAIAAGCNDYIAKPIKKLELYNLLGKHF